MAQLLNIFGFLAVLLRAATLSFESLVVGGILFGALVTNPGASRRLIRWAAVGLALAQLAFVASDAAILQATAGLSFAELAGANFAIAGAVTIAAAIFVVLWHGSLPWLLAPAAVFLASSVMTSHAAARIEHRGWLILLTALHQGATAAWIGGLPYLLIALGRTSSEEAQRSAARFSRLAQFSVAGILLGGIGLGVAYIDSIEGLYATSYGVMVLGKAVMFVLLLFLGGLNFLVVRGVRDSPSPLLARLRRLSEAEIGIGFTVILAAASLTSQPPAVDLTTGRVTPREVAQRMTPRTPRFQSPQVTELSAPALPSDDPAKLQSFVPGGASRPSTPADIAWSEYNHNWSGLVVLCMGLLAVASRVFGLRWARHWPLAFLGLALFLLFRADADAWPLGPKSFWGSMLDPEILQHRVFALLIVAFAVFEWGIQVGQIHSQAAALVFPGVCAVGGALLMTHSHALGNVKEEYLAELSHLSIAIFAVIAGWSRWSELRLDGAWRRIPAMIWPVCFVAIGLLLLFYREA